MPKVQVAVKGIIVDDGKFLIISQVINRKEIWEIPGGRIEHNSTPEKCLIREIKEEVGIDAEIIRLVGTYYFFRSDNNDQIICITYLCRPRHTNIDLSKNIDVEEQIGSFRWVTKEELLKSKLELPHPSLKELIERLEF